MADLWKYAVGSCIGSLVTGAVVLVTLEHGPSAVSEPAVPPPAAADTPPPHRPTRVAEIETEARSLGGVEPDNVVIRPDPPREAQQKKHLELLADHVLPDGLQAQAESETASQSQRANARKLLRRMDRYDRRIQAEPEAPDRAEGLIDALHESLAATSKGTYVQAGVCSETLCRFSLIHETDEEAMLFNPHMLDGVDESGHVDLILDRGEDGELRHWLYLDSAQ